MKYLVIDNVGNIHYLESESDEEVLELLKQNWINYIYSIFGDCIVVFRPNGYLLCYINTATGDQIVKTMSDWGVEC